MRFSIGKQTNTAAVPTRASLRRLLLSVFRTDPELDAFCLDHFPEVHNEFTIGMLRSSKLNILLSRIPTTNILNCLKEIHAEAIADKESLLVLGDGNDDLPTSILDVRGRRNRQRMIQKVRKFWIEGVLEKSLHGAVLIELGKEYRPDAVSYPWSIIIEGPDIASQPISTDKRLIDLFDDNRELLILGQPGAGKTTMLLDLCRDLLKRAEVDEAEPIPVVFNLATWARKPIPLAQWILSEMDIRYGVSEQIASPWLKQGNIIPLLDGGDEIAEELRDACISEIEIFRKDNFGAGTVACMRTAEYYKIKQKLGLAYAIEVQPLSQSDVFSYLVSVGLPQEIVNATLNSHPQLLEMARNPLFLSLATEFLLDAKNRDIMATDRSEDGKRFILRSYVSQMLLSRKNSIGSCIDPHRIISGLHTVAKSLLLSSGTLFQIEDIQPQILWEGRHGLRRILAFVLFSCPCLLFTILFRMAGKLPERLETNTILIWLFGLLVALPMGVAATRREIRLRDTNVISWSRIIWIGVMLFAFIGSMMIARIETWSDSELPGVIAIVIIFLFMALILCAWIYPWLLMITLPLFYDRSVIGKSANPGQGITMRLKTIFSACMVSIILSIISDMGWTIFLAFVQAFSNVTSFNLPASMMVPWRITYPIALIGFIVSFHTLGGFDLLIHCTLRFVLAFESRLPLRLVWYLNACVQYNFLRQVGCGYIFIHRLLMEYFCSLSNDDIDRLAADVRSKK